MAENTLIDAYLDDLLAALTVSPRRARRILAETEHHLDEAVADRVAAGIEPARAAEEAISAFGTAAEIAARFNTGATAAPLRQWLPGLVSWLYLLAAVGMVAVGVAGELATGFGLAYGKEYVAGDKAGVAYTPARCADFFEYHPEASSCSDAALLHHFDETWRNADVMLVGGLLNLGGAWFWRRRQRRGEGPHALGRSAFAIGGLACFGGLAPLLLLYGAADIFAGGGQGSALYLSGGAIALVAALAFARPGWNELRFLALARI